MKSQNKLIFFLLLVTILLIFTISAVFAASLETFLSEQARLIFSDWYSGRGVNENIAKVLLTVIIAILVYSVSSTIPMLDVMFRGGKEIIGVIFSLIVAFLSTAYLTPFEVYTIITSYSALGVTFGSIIPFVIVGFFIIGLVVKPHSDSRIDAFSLYVRKILAIITLLFFTVYLAIRLALLTGSSEISGQELQLVWWIHIALIAICIIALLTFTYWTSYLTKAYLREQKARFSEVMEKGATAYSVGSRVFDEVSGGKSGNPQSYKV